MTEEKSYSLVEVPTQTTIAIQTPEGELWNLEKAVVELLNKIDELSKAIK